MAPFIMSTLLSTLLAFGLFAPLPVFAGVPFSPSGALPESTEELLSLSCMLGEDYIIIHGTFDGFDEYMNRMSEMLFARRQSENFNRRLYYNGLSCARAIAKVDGVEIPSQYTLK